MNVVCFKTGDKYSSEYVNKLYSMVKRNTSFCFNFICFTDDPVGIKRHQESHIDVRPLPHEGLSHWWNRMALFKEGVLTGPCINIDLDVVIHDNIDELFELDDSFYMVKGEKFGCLGYNDCVVKFNANKHNFMWEKFIKHKGMFGTQVDNAMTLILELGNHEHKLFPDEWFWRFWNREEKASQSKFCHFSMNESKQGEIDDELIRKHWR